MYNILEDLNIDQILDPIIDKRKTDISQLSVNQLKHECNIRNLNDRGKKVFQYLNG